jgi:hypothetical protein
MLVTQAVFARCPRVNKIQRAVVRRRRGVALLACAVSIGTIALTACSGPSNGSSSSNEGAVGANGGGSGPGNVHNSYGPGHAPQAFKTAGQIGSQPGKLVLKPASGSTSISPTWSTRDACPAGYQTSAQLDATMWQSANFQWISGTVYPGNSPIAAGQQLMMGASVAEVQQVTHTPNGQTDKWVVRCAALQGGLGDRQFVQYLIVHFSADGKSYTTSS